MLFFRAILAVLLGFGSLLIGMEKEEALVRFKYSNPYFDPELQKSLTLIMLKNRNAQEVVDLDQDALRVIAQNSYSLYKDEQFLSKNFYTSDNDSDWCNRRRIFNDPERRKIFQGEEIWFTDFDFVTMNDEGRDIFKRISYNIPYSTKEHSYALDKVNLRLLKDQKRSYSRENSIITDDIYNAVLKVPLRLRSKVGKLCTVKVIGEEEKSIFDRWYVVGMTGLGGVLGALALDMSEGLAIGAFAMNRVGTFAFIMDRQNNIKQEIITFKVVEKPLITSEEQKMMKQAEQESKEREQQRAKEKEFAKFMSKTENFEQLPQELSNRTQLDLLSLRNRV